MRRARTPAWTTCGSTTLDAVFSFLRPLSCRSGDETAEKDVGDGLDGAAVGVLEPVAGVVEDGEGEVGVGAALRERFGGERQLALAFVEAGEPGGVGAADADGLAADGEEVLVVEASVVGAGRLAVLAGEAIKEAGGEGVLRGEADVYLGGVKRDGGVGGDRVDDLVPEVAGGSEVEADGLSMPQRCD